MNEISRPNLSRASQRTGRMTGELGMSDNGFQSQDNDINVFPGKPNDRYGTKLSMKEFQIDNTMNMHNIDMGTNSADVTGYAAQFAN